MNLYRSMGLQAAPFGSTFDERAWYDGGGYGEALATLQFAMTTGKACTVVLGDSGSGKSHLAQLACRRAAIARPVLWVYASTRGDLSPRATFLRRGFQDRAQSVETDLHTWLTHTNRDMQTPLVVVDDADQLRAAHWGVIASALSSELRFDGQLSIILLATPPLFRQIRSRDYARLQRRVFRVLSLDALAPAEAVEYLRARVAAVGGALEDFFDDDAVEQIVRATRGRPGLINQLADNALLEALAAERRRVAMRDVVRGAVAMVGGGTHTLEAPKRSPRLTTSSARGIERRHAELSGKPPRRLLDFDSRMQRMQQRLGAALDVLRGSTGKPAAAARHMSSDDGIIDQEIAEQVSAARRPSRSEAQPDLSVMSSR